MRHDQNRVFFFQIQHQVFNLERGNRVQSGSRFVHQQDFGLHGDGARNAKPLLLSARKPERGSLQPVFRLLEQRGRLQAVFYNLIQVGLTLDPVDARPVGDIVVYAHHKGIGLLKNHSDLFAEYGHIHLGIVDILAVQQNFALNPHVLHDVIHAVDRL
ncbi:hypothetical protein SDC9_147846 [bioreactor metagenome]|uniref:Uncharacterized protein n=1 Tax=bioreactor metagenome TaxID=1076179 RepID=A0A645EH52_9ZZZZ